MPGWELLMDLARALIRESVEYYHEQYPEEELMLSEYSERFDKGTWDYSDIVDIIEWKNEERFKEYNPRQFTEYNSEGLVQETINEVLEQSSVAKQLELLTDLDYVSVPTASAILVFMDPLEYSVIDWKAWGALAKLGYVEGDLSQNSIEQYLFYLGICRAMSRFYDVSLRDLDRALWMLGGDT